MINRRTPNHMDKMSKNGEPVSAVIASAPQTQPQEC